VVKQNSKEIEYMVWGKGPLPSPGLPVEELPLWTANGQGEALTEGELDGISRFQELTKGKWFDITKPDWATGQPD
jgi:hypothetical protein